MKENFNLRKKWNPVRDRERNNHESKGMQTFILEAFQN